MIALRNLLRRRLRSLFALLQISVAIAAFVSIVGVTTGLRGQFYRLGEVFAYDLVVQAAGVPSPIFSTAKDCWPRRGRGWRVTRKSWGRATRRCRVTRSRRGRRTLLRARPP